MSPESPWSFYLTCEIISDTVAQGLNETGFYSSPNHCGMTGLTRSRIAYSKVRSKFSAPFLIYGSLLADSAIECYREGASIVHIHVRDPKRKNPSQMAGMLGRELASPNEAKEILGIR